MEAASRLREIGKIVLNPSIADLRSRATRALLFVILAEQVPENEFTPGTLKAEIESRFGLRNFPEILLVSELERLKAESYVFPTDGGWKIPESSLATIGEEITSANKIVEAFSNGFYEFVRKQTGNLDSYQKVFVSRALDRIVSHLLERLGDTAASFFTGASPSPDGKDFREIVKDSVNEIREPTIENAEIVKSAIGPAFEEALSNPTKEFAQGLEQVTSAYVMLRVLNADPGLRAVQEELFSSCDLFLDTNVLIAYLCEESARHEYTNWLLRATGSLQVNIWLSEITLAEFNRSVDTAGYLYKKYYKQELSGELLNNEIARTYLQQYRNTLSWEEYVERLVEKLDEMTSDYAIDTLLYEENFIEPVQLANVHKIVSQATMVGLEGRAYDVVDHDAYSLLLIQRLRRANPDGPFSSPWFLTHDSKLKKADNRVRQHWAFDLEATLSPEEWYEIIHPFLGPKMLPEHSPIFFSMMVAGTLLPLPPVSVRDFVAYVAAEIDLPEEDERTLLRIIEERRLETALQTQLLKPDLTQAVGTLYDGIAELLAQNKDLVRKTNTIERLVRKNKELTSRVGELEESFSLEPEGLKEKMQLVELASTNEEKKKSLEDLGGYLLEGVAGWKIIARDRRSATSELDILVGNGNRTDPFLVGMGYVIPVECKNWRMPVGCDEIRDFFRDLDKRRFTHGILISHEGVTGSKANQTFARKELWDSFRDGVHILVITMADIEEVAQGKSLVSVLRTKDLELRLSG